MRIFVTVENNPAVIVGYGPGIDGIPKAIVIGLAPHPVAVALELCVLPQLPKRLIRKIRRHAKIATREAIREVAEAGGGSA